jgi:ABC-type multidrug transport system ATPase subunit
MHYCIVQVGGCLAGGLMLRGISGGERRRLSIAVGILAAPSVLFLDEPTSGLDSFAALNVMGYLQGMARTTGRVIISTIHQPRTAIWEMFGRVSCRQPSTGLSIACQPDASLSDELATMSWSYPRYHVRVSSVVQLNMFSARDNAFVRYPFGQLHMHVITN